MRRSVRPLLASLAGVALLLSCVDGNEPLAPKGGTSVRVALAAELVPAPANATAKPINKIRATARTVPEGSVLLETSLAVDPTADSWDLPLDLPVDGLSMQVIVEIRLINVDASGAETVEFSGQVGPLVVRPGSDGAPISVPVVRGPLDNLAVTGVDITNAAPALVEGAARTLTANVTTNRTGANPTLFWTSLTPTLLSLNGAAATALLPGTARVIATAGPVSDTVDIQIVQRPAAVTTNPATQSVELGSEATFTALVMDPRGQPITGQPVLWRSLDPTILELVSSGRFRALGVGTGRVEARAAADTTLKTVATVKVGRKPVDLAVTKTTTTVNAVVGDAVAFTVSVANLGDVEAAAVRVRDQLPTGLTLEGATASNGSFDAATSTWNVGNLAAGARATLDVRTRLTAGTVGTAVANTAALVDNPDQTDPNAANNSATAQFAVGPTTNDLIVTKTASRASMIEISDTVTFTVSALNAGSQSVTSLVVADSMPSGLTILTNTATRGSYDPATRLWTIGTLASGESVTLTVSAKANAGSGATTQTNMARVWNFVGPRDPTPSNDRATAGVAVVAANQADVAITKTVTSNPTPRQNDTVTFSVKARNNGPLVATVLQVRDSLGAGLALFSATTAVGTWSANTNVWTIPTLAAGDSAFLTVRAIVTAAAGQTATNTARYLGGQVPDAVPANNVAVASVTVASNGTDISMSQTVDVATPFELFGRVHFTVVATNAGPGTATNIVVMDKLPFGLTVDSTRTANGTILGDTLWTIPSLAQSATAQMHIYARVNDATAGIGLTNTARRIAMDQVDPVAPNDVGSAIVTPLRRKLDVRVRKTASNANPAINTAFTYRVVVTNLGPGPATLLTGADTISAALTVDSVRATVGTFVPNTWTIGTLAQGDSAVLTAYVRVPAAASGQAIVNRAWRTGIGQADTVAANDSSRVVVNIPINNRPVVTISLPANNAVFNPGDTVTFTAVADDVEDGPLTGAIAWASNVSGALGTGGTVRRSTLAPGPHLVTATVTDRDGNVAADTVPLTIAIVTTPTTLNLPYGGSASMPISLSAPAPAGGLVLTITSSDTTKVKPVTTTVTIPAGALSANAQLNGVLPGSAVVTAATQGYGSSTTSVSVTASLNIVQGSVSFPQGYSGAFTVRLESQGVQIAAPSGGISVSLTSSNPLCVAVASPVVIPAGQVSVNATATYGGTATTPCNTTVNATATSITSDVFTVFVNTSPALTVYANPVGSGLLTSGSVSMDYAQHGGVTVHVQSSDPAVLLVSANSTTPGTAFIDVAVPNGSSGLSYYIQGVEGQTGSVAIQATATGFLTDTAMVSVQQPALQLASLGTSYTSLDNDVPFYVYVGISDMYYGGVNGQAIRPGGTPVTATITTSDSSKATLVTSAGTAATRTVQVPVGQYYSPTSVATGGVALDLRAAGSTVVQATIPGFIQRPSASVTVGITAPGIQPYAATVGGGLQIQTQAYLGASNHGGVTVHLVSSDSFAVRLSPNATTPGTGTLDVVVPQNNTYVPYYVQGMEAAVAQVASVNAAVRITAPGFVTDSAIVTVQQPYVALAGVSTNHTSLDPDQAFYAQVGVTDIYYGGVNAQAVRAGGPTLTVTFTSSDASKARLVNAAGAGGSLNAQIPPGQYYSPTSVASGGVALDVLAAGTTTVQASIPGVQQRPGATVVVTITAPDISAYPVEVGSGLQAASNAYLGASNHGGVTAHLVSGNPSVALLSPNATTAGTGTLDVVVPNGSTSISYYVQGVEGTTGTSVVTVTAPGFTQDTASVTVSQPYVALSGPPATTTTLTPNSTFYALVGLSDIYYGGVNPQPVRAGGTPLTVTLGSSQVGVGQIKTAAGTSGTGTVTIPVGAYYSPTNGGIGGSEFDPVGAGTTTVSASIPGFVQRPSANAVITVSSPAITMSSGVTVGGGLMTQASVFLGASGHGGVTLRIKSSSGAIARVSANSTTLGADSVDIPVAANVTSVNFWIHGMDQQTGTIAFTASAPGFTDGSGTVTVVQSGVQITSLGTSYSATAANILFYAYVGYASGNGVVGQARRAGAPDLVATITSSQPAAGTLVTSAGTAASRTVNIAAGQQLSPSSLATGGIYFDPVAQGSTTVNVTTPPPGFVTTPAATVNVTIGP